MAIWNREKIVILIAMGVWATDVVFLINGEYPEYPLPIIEVFLTSAVDITGSVRVNISTMTILDLQGLFANRRSVIRGRVSVTPASCSTQGA
jgi:hypothetical protein